MKKVLSVLLSVMLMGCIYTVSSTAATSENLMTNEKIVSESVEYLSDGSSITITVSEFTNINVARASTYSKSGAKTYTARDSEGNVNWKFILNGTFSVNSGVSATCTSASYSTSSLASGWSLKSGSTSRSGNQAIGDGTFQHKVLFIVTNTESCHVVLSCDANGNLS